MKFSSTKNIILNLYYFIFSFILFVLLIQSIRAGYSKESWQITEFLINYQGGFVRRGLLGELIYIMYNLFGLNPYNSILTISFFSLFALIWFFAQSIIKKGYPIFFLPFVFFLGNPIINGFWVRKDVFIILIFILTIYFSTKKSNLSFIIPNFFLIIGLLIHESIGFFCFPILFLILISKNYSSFKTRITKIKSIFISFSQLIPSIIVFLCVLYFKGSYYIANQIWNSWKPISFPIQSEVNHEIPAAIHGLSWTLQQGISFTIYTLKNFNDGIYAPIGWFFILVLIYYVLTNTDKLNFKILNYKPNKNFDKQNISNILLIQLCSLIPLFILGWDYGRWVFFWITSSFAIILLVPEKKLSFIYPKIITTISSKTNSILDLFLCRSNILLLSILIGFPAYSWSLTSTINTNSITIILKFISKILKHLLVIIKEIII